jgi:hypothetical protein
MRERSEHYARLQRGFANVEAAVAIVGMVLLCAFGYAFYSAF